MNDKIKWPWLIFIATLIIGIAAIASVDPGTEVPIHWNASGEVDRTSSPFVAFMIAPLVQLLTLIIFSFLGKLEPRQENLEHSAKAVSAVILSVTILMLIIQAVVLAAVFKPGLFGVNMILAGIGLMFTIIGNYLGKLRSSYFVGIRTPWTLSSETVWKKTHRLGGKLLVMAGSLIFIASFILPTSILFYVMMITLTPAVLIPILYSWVVWRSEKEEHL